jgi:multidrug resistance efflux pump
VGIVVVAAIAGIVCVVSIIARTTIKIAQVRAAHAGLPSADLTARLDELESTVAGLQDQLTEAQERLDFAERLLMEARQERRIGS